MEEDNLNESLYEDKFEKELEASPGGYHDDQLEELLMQEDLFGVCKDDEALLDHSTTYTDGDADLEKALTNGNVILTAEDIEKREKRLLYKRFLQFFKIRRRSTAGLDSFYDGAEGVGLYDSTTPDSGVHENLQNMDPEQRAKLEEEWRNDLTKTEESIQTLRTVLASQIKHSQDLKRKLGITAWKEFRDDMEQGIKNVKESSAYQKTNVALKSATEKTSTALGSIGSSVSRKLGDVKNSTAFRSFEEKVGSVYTNVRVRSDSDRTKMSGSRSSSMQNFEEALENAEGRKSGTATPATTPTIPEGKPM